MKTVSINLYNFAELSETAKEKAIFEHETFLLSIGQEVENENGEMVTEYPETIDRADVIENIEANEYFFFANGELAAVTKYVGKHPKAGQTELKFAGEIYTI